MAVRRLRVRRCNCLGLDGDLHLPSESLRVAFAYAHGNGNRNAYSYGGTEVDSLTTAPSDAGASAVALRAPNDWAIDD
jgi:hypothetical protein